MITWAAAQPWSLEWSAPSAAPTWAVPSGCRPAEPASAEGNGSSGDHSETADQYQPAINRILHDQDHPCRLILPIIER
jgi:hypothetical protein